MDGHNFKDIQELLQKARERLKEVEIERHDIIAEIDNLKQTYFQGAIDFEAGISYPDSCGSKEEQRIGKACHGHHVRP
jgi:hypothetical protein